MKMFLVAAAGLVALSLPAHAAGSTTVTDAPLFKSNTMQQLAQRPYDPSAGSVGFKRPTEMAQRREDPSAGSVGFKKSKKNKKKAKK